MTAGGQTAAAIEAFAGLSQKYPRDGQIQEDFALALSAAKDRKTLEMAREKWHEVETKSRAGGDRWFRARYQLAAVMFRLGDRDKASTVITSTQALYPSLGGPELQGRFEALLKRMEK